MTWIIIAIIVGLIILLVGLGYCVRTIKKRGRPEGRPRGAGMSTGLAIGMAMCVAIGIALSELGGYHNVIPLSIVMGSCVGVIIGSFLERRYKKP